MTVFVKLHHRGGSGLSGGERRVYVCMCIRIQYLPRDKIYVKVFMDGTSVNHSRIGKNDLNGYIYINIVFFNSLSFSLRICVV